MQYSNPRTKKTAQRIPILCGLLFVGFCFCFLYEFQWVKLAQTQHYLSGGLTVYRRIFTAVSSTAVLTLLGIIVDRLLHEMPMRWHAVSWMPSFVLLGLFTDRHFPFLGDVGTGVSWWGYLVLAICFLGLVSIGFSLPDSSKENECFSSYAWPNVFMLVAFMVLTIGLSNTSDSLQRIVRNNQAMAQGNGEEVLRCAALDDQASRHETAMVAWALSGHGMLGERFFEFNHPDGSEALLPALQDSVLIGSLPDACGRLLGYIKGDKIRAVEFLEIIQPLPATKQPMARDYLLMAYLLDRRLDDFVQLLGVGDSVPTYLPRAYAEALTLYEARHPDVTFDYLSPAMRQSFAAFEEQKKSTKEPYALYSLFGTSYWYYFFSSTQKVH